MYKSYSKAPRHRVHRHTLVNLRRCIQMVPAVLVLLRPLQRRYPSEKKLKQRQNGFIGGTLQLCSNVLDMLQKGSNECECMIVQMLRPLVPCRGRGGGRLPRLTWLVERTKERKT